MTSSSFPKITTDGLVLAYDFGNDRCQSAFRTPNSATGGVLVSEYTRDGEVYVRHIFTSLVPSTFVPNQSMEVEYLVVGGGGGGGGIIASGGGGGGVVYGTMYISGPQDVVVGNGGKGGSGWNSLNQGGDRGQNSSFGNIVAYGGGGGGAFGGNGTAAWYGTPKVHQVNGGSGGGSTLSLAAGTGVSGQGNAGGSGADTNRGAGGGGAGAVGGTPPSTGGGNGGAGLDYSAIFGSVLFDSGRFGGGGGGGIRSGVSGVTAAGTGGIGGGGAGSTTSVAASDGTLNSGGGGGGAGYNGENYSTRLGGYGGSGTVIVQYKKYPSLRDLSGNGLNATPRNNVAYSTLGGGSLVFDGTDDRLVIPGSEVLSLNTMTISAWVYSTNFSHNGFIFEKTTNGNVNTQYSLFFTATGTLAYRTYGLSTVTHSPSLTTLGISNSNWYNIVATFDGSIKKIYVNGVLKYSSAALTGTVTQNTTGVSYIGSHGLNYSYHLNGNIAAEHIYNRALTQTEITQNYNALKSRFGL